MNERHSVSAAIDRMLQRMPSIDRLKKLFHQTGFVEYETVVPFNEVLQGKQYSDPSGPLNPAWRAGDSCWSLATESELDRAMDEVNTRLADGNGVLRLLVC